jgi:hypothetical protein
MNANELLAIIYHEIGLAEYRNDGKQATIFISRDLLAMLSANNAEIRLNTSDIVFIVTLFGREVKPIGGSGEVYVGFKI